MPLNIVRNNIANMNVDVIVNSANPKPTIGAGVDSAIHQAAGSQLLEARQQIGNIDCGQAYITDGFDLNSKYVIHTVGPKHTQENVEQSLIACYNNSLLLAKQYKCKSIAFPLISTGVYGVDKALALQLAIQTIQKFLLKHEMMVYLVVYDKESYQLSEKLYNDIQCYIDEYYIDNHKNLYSRNRVLKNCEIKRCLAPCVEESTRSLEDIIFKLDETFSEYLLRMIDYKGMKDPEVYKKANMDRRHFSKIRSNKNYQPSKNTAIALAFALELNIDETSDLLLKAGYALTHSSKADIIVEYFIEQENYNLFELNEVLFAFDQPTIGG